MEMLQTAVDGPFTLDIIGGADISLSTRTVVRSKERIELATMMLQRCSPLTTTIHRTLLHVILRRIGKFRENIVHCFPVYQILRFHDRRTRHQMHGGAYHIEAVAHTDYIHIRHISPNHRIGEILFKLPPVEIKEFASLQSLENEVYIMLSCHFLHHLCRESLPLFPATSLADIYLCHQFTILFIEMNLQRTAER